MAQEDLILLEEAPNEKEELEIVPDLDAAYLDRRRRLEPSTTDFSGPDLAPHLELIPIPGAERGETDDQLFRRIEEDITYKPTNAELDKYLEDRERRPKYAIDFVKGGWEAGKGVVTDLAKGIWGAVKDPELFMFTPKGMSKRATTLAEGAARATWDLGTVGRYLNDWFSEQGDREYKEEIEDMRLRQSNPDWRMRGAMGGESYLTKKQKDLMRKSWVTSYIKKRIDEDLDELEVTTDDFTTSRENLKRNFNRRGLTYVDGESRDFYTSSKYINDILPAKQRDKYYNDFPNWIKKRKRDRWRRGRYLQSTIELARRGEKTVLGELFGPEVDEVAKAFVNNDVATLASYAGGPAEGAAVLSTKLARKATSPSILAGKAAELAGKGTQIAGEKIKQIGEWATTSPERSAALGAALGAAAGDDGITIAKGVIGGLAEQRIRVTPKIGELLQKGGTALEAVGEVVSKPEGVEGLLKSASRIAKDEDLAKTFNKLSWLDPAINFGADLTKGSAAGGATGLILTLPSGDPQVTGGGFVGGATGGFFSAIPGRYLTRGAKLKEQLRNEWAELKKQLSPEQVKNINQYAPTLEEVGNVITTLKMLNGVTRGGGNIDFEFLTPAQFAKAYGVDPRTRGAEISAGKVRPLVSINVGYRGPNSLYHESWHALKRFAGETELQKTAEGKQEVAVLKPYLEKIQTILFGKKLGGKTVEKGMFSESDLLEGFYDQYTSKMSPEMRKSFDRQFEYNAKGEKLTPEEANQKKLNKMMEEVEAESFRYLMSHANPRQIAQGNRSLHQKFIDHMLLSEHSRTLRGMRKALETVGVNFKPSGEPSDIFAVKGKGLTNSRELNAALRQYLRAWEGLQYRTRVKGELEPSGFSIGGTGKAGRAQVEFHLNRKENDFLRDHFSSSDILKKTETGEVHFDPDGRVVLLTEGDIRKLQQDRAELIRNALEETDDGTGMTLKENGAFEGLPSPQQLDAIDLISDKILTPNQKQIIRETADIMRNDPGAPIQFLYNAALGKGKRYSSSLSSTHRTAVPIGFHVSKAQNFYFTALDLGAYHRKISAWGDPTKKALHKGGHKLALWDKDVKAFEADLFKYLENHKFNRPGDTGLDPSPQKAQQKRNVLNDFFNINKGEEGVTEGNFNPVAAARRAVDPETGKQKKRAYRGLENLLRSYRLDRVLDEDFGKSMSYALGKAVPMKSGADFYQKQLKNLMPAPGEDMVAVHNLSADNLKHSLKMGGIASPSMAIVDIAKADFDSFGEITLVASKDLVDPKKGAKVFGSDAYSPRYPDITTEFPKETSGKIREFLKPYEALGKSDFDSIDLANSVEDRGWSRGAEDHAGLQAAYLKEKGMLPDLDAIALEGSKKAEKHNQTYWEGQAVKGALRKAVREPKVYEEFKSWIEDLPEREGWQFEEKIFRGFTPMGNRRYQPHTLDNVVKIMKRNIRGGEGFNYGVGTVRSKVTPQFRSVAQIKKNRGKLTDPRSMKIVKDEASRQMNDLADAMEPHLKYTSSDRYLDLGVFTEHLQEAAERGVRSLRSYYDEGAPFEKVTEFLGKLKDLPTGYFEAKIPRAVQLQEFEAAIIPSDLDPKLKKVLEKRGLELREYDRKEVGKFNPKRLTRREALQKQTEEADLRFMPAPTFYSKAERAVEGAKGGIFNKEGLATIDQAKSLFVTEKKNRKEYKVPEAELEWSGVLDWLEGRKEEAAEMSGRLAGGRTIKEDIANAEKSIGFLKEELSSGKIIDPFGQLEPKELDPIRRAANERALASYSEDLAKLKRIEAQGHKVSKAELLEFLQNKGVKVEEVARGRIGADLEKLSSDSLPEAVNNIYDIYRADDPDGTRYGSIGQLTELNEKHPTIAKMKYGKGQPFVLNLSLKDDTLTFKTFEEANSYIQGVTSETLFRPGEKWTMLPGDEKAQQSYGELVLTLPKERGKSHETFDLPGSHRFPEENILAHIRFTERVDADGKKMLFLEEVQSDWNKEIRDLGVRTDRPAEVQKEILRLKTEREKIYRGKDPEEWHRRNKLVKELEEKYPVNPSGAPDMPYKGGKWEDLVLKRMMRWAADNGFDRLGWITGKDTAERYNLQKEVNSIRYFKKENGEAELTVTDKEGRIVFDWPIKSESDIEQHLGKNLASKLLTKEPLTGSNSKGQHQTYWLEGDDLAISPEWAINLYDRALPNKAKKLVKKKGAVGVTRLGEETAKNSWLVEIEHKERALKNGKKELVRLEREKAAGNKGGVVLEKAISDMKKIVRETEGELQELRDKQNNQKTKEANYVDITPEVKALAEEGFSYFMPAGSGRGRATAPTPTGATLPATPIMPRVRLTEEEKEDSRRLLNLLKKKGI